MVDFKIGSSFAEERLNYYGIEKSATCKINCGVEVGWPDKRLEGSGCP